MESNKVIISADGSHTVVSKEFGVSYHSLHGALEESCHIFISAGIYNQYLKGKRNINIFEMGFGTGLNAWLSILEGSRLSSNIKYTGVELYPVEIELIDQLNYIDLINCTDEESSLFKSLHDLPWNKTHKISSRFTFEKHRIGIEDFELDDDIYDIIFFDAFAPSSQAPLWEKELHTKLFNSLKPGGTLVTYCAKGVFKRTLKEIGYHLESLNGPGRKHEMTRAVKPEI